MKEDPSSQSLSRQLFETYVALDNWHKFRLRLFIEGIFVGIFGGLCISLFRFLLGEAEALRILCTMPFSFLLRRRKISSPFFYGARPLW